MNFFKKLKPVIAPEKIIKDYGLVSEQRKGIVKFKYDVLLIEEHAKKKVVIRESNTLFGGDVCYFEFDVQSVKRLKDILDKASRIM